MKPFQVVAPGHLSGNWTDTVSVTLVRFPRLLEARFTLRAIAAVFAAMSTAAVDSPS